MFTVGEIIEESEKLEMSNCPTIGSFMVKRWGIDWNNKENPSLVNLANTLDCMMEVHKFKHPNGYDYYEWWAK